MKRQNKNRPFAFSGRSAVIYSITEIETETETDNFIKRQLSLALCFVFILCCSIFLLIGECMLLLC